jgi:hypothetical protein
VDDKEVYCGPCYAPAANAIAYGQLFGRIVTFWLGSIPIDRSPVPLPEPMDVVPIGQ